MLNNERKAEILTIFVVLVLTRTEEYFALALVIIALVIIKVCLLLYPSTRDRIGRSVVFYDELDSVISVQPAPWSRFAFLDKTLYDH